jgi:uncharacterized protein YbjT (DUF2867 family)
MVLVVGAIGFLGSEVVRRLGGRGEPTRTLVRKTANPSGLKPSARPAQSLSLAT